MHFSAFPEHRAHVLLLYRYTLRTVQDRIHSQSFRKLVRQKIRTTISNNKNNKSSWSVRDKILKLETLSKAINDGDLDCVEKLIAEGNVKPDITQVKRMVKDYEKYNTPPRQDPKVLRSCNVVDRYIKIKQSQGLIAPHISKKIKRHLLTPVALDWDANNKIQRIRAQLEKGVPNTYLAYTKAGPNTIWFIRSPLNRHKSQSKKLSHLISTTKKRCQEDLDTIDTCHSIGRWAIAEGLWEEYISTGRLLQINDTTDLFKKVKIGADKLKQQNHIQAESVNGIPFTLFHWVEPLSAIISDISKRQDAETKYFDEYKNKKLIEEGQLEFYKEKTAAMHERRKARFDNMMKNEIPHALTFDEGRDLTTILERNKF